jgi:hypothetical protein
LFFLIGFDDAPHAVVNAAFVQVIIGFDLISVLVSNSDQKKTSLSMVICRMTSSKHWSYSSSLTGQRPIFLACFEINRLFNYSLSCVTSIFVAGVESTVWTQSWPLLVLCYLGGSI